MGRGLTQQHIFSIYDTDGDGKFNEESIASSVSNATAVQYGRTSPSQHDSHLSDSQLVGLSHAKGDFMADNDKFSDEPFDER
eukprot:5507016-Amphidinium_carterae.1